MSVPRAAESQAPRGSTETSTATRAPRPERWGNHGWDPGVPSMRAFFMVTGPKIRQGVTVAPVRNLDVYPLLTELLDLQPAPDIDGRAGVIRSLIEDVAVPAKR